MRRTSMQDDHQSAYRSNYQNIQTVPDHHQQTLKNIDSSLRSWWNCSQSEVSSFADDGLVYGTGYNSWGVQTQQKGFSVAAYLALRGDEVAAVQFLKMLRFNLQSHVSASARCNDGEQWGHTWISVLGIERMMFSIDALLEADLIPASELQLMRQVFLSEADWILNEYDIVAGLVDDNKPESNIWNGSFLHRIAMMYPESESAEAYRYKGDLFLLHGISIESDLHADKNIAGKVLKDNIVGANFYESMALNHHHYLNVGYMVICLSNIAMLHFSFKRNGQEAPAALYHNVEKLWQLVRMLTFDDGRLWRIGGDTRARYCYCQDYALPMWLLIEDYLNEDCAHFIDAWCGQVFREQALGGDDAYLSERLSQMREYAPAYFTRLESDRACSLAMTAMYLPCINHEHIQESQPRLSSWHDAYHGAYAVAGDQRCASWVWAAADGPTGTCVSPGASDMAEWGANLFPRVCGMGDRNGYNVVSEHGQCFEGGFATLGTVKIIDFGVVVEGGGNGYHIADAQVLAIALPDQSSCVYFQYVTSHLSHYFSSIQGLHLKIPNDLWNDYQRHLVSAGTEQQLQGNDGLAVDHTMGSRELIIDNKLKIQGLYQASVLDDNQNLIIKRQAQRGTPLLHLPAAQVQRAGGCLHTEDICLPHFEPASRCLIGDGAILVDTAFTVSCDPEKVFSM